MKRVIKIGNTVISINRIISIFKYSARPIKRLKMRYDEQKLLIDITGGSKARSLILTDDNHMYLSSMTIETLNKKINEID